MYSEQYDESIDVYAFGMCLLEMATGEYPYQECMKPFEIYKRVINGIKPENFKRIDDDDLKELIDLCIRRKKHQRPTVKELLNHSWFMENNGLKLELHKDPDTKRIEFKSDQITFRLKLIDKSKHKNWPDNEAIDFIYDVNSDVAENVVKELKDNLEKINDEDVKFLVQAIKDKCHYSKLERNELLEEENKNRPNNTMINNTNNSSSLSVNEISTNLVNSDDNSTSINVENISINSQQIDQNSQINLQQKELLDINEDILRKNYTLQSFEINSFNAEQIDDSSKDKIIQKISFNKTIICMKSHFKSR